MSKKRKIHFVQSAAMPEMNVALYHDRDKLQRDLRNRKIETPLFSGSAAQTFTLDVKGKEISFVLMELPTSHPLWVQLGLLAHEATHVATQYFAGIGEEEPGEEELAYAVQAAAGCLFDMHLSWLDKHEGKKNEKKD